jgi:Ca2+-binding RTX toxin-like protein
LEVLVARYTCHEGEGAAVRQGHLIAVVGIFLIGCAVLLLVVGCAGTTSSETSNKKEQGSSPQATDSEEEARCEGTRKIKWNGGSTPGGVYTTNDLPGCPKGGLLLGTDKRDMLNGFDGDDEIRGLGGNEDVWGGDGNDVIYGGPGNDSLEGDKVHEKNADVIYGADGDDGISGGEGADVIYGGDGNDYLEEGGAGKDVHPDEFYCGKGKDEYRAGKNDYVSSSCEKKLKPPKPVF